MASEWNLWVWLQCIGVASGCCCKKVQWNLIIMVTLGPNLAGCYIKVVFLLNGIQNHHN